MIVQPVVEPMDRFAALNDGGHDGGQGGAVGGATFSQLMGDLLAGKPRIPGVQG